jgi:GGDEF domain-containing protein
LRDPETGLVNRMLFLDRLGAAIKRTRRPGDYDCALVLIRVAAAEVDPAAAQAEAWREVVRRLLQALSDGDSAARLRLEEFAVLLDDVGPGAARVDELVASAQSGWGVGTAIGVLRSIRPFRDADETLRAADIAVLRAGVAPRAVRGAPPDQRSDQA